MNPFPTATPLTTASFRFFGKTGDFLIPGRCRRTFRHTVKGHPSVKDTVEALGVPHPEIDAIFVDGRPAAFSYQLKGGEKIAVYPPAYPHRRARVRHLARIPRGRPGFVVDSHLGRLVRHLRLLGFDSLYRKIFPDADIVRLGVRERRIILTRDVGLLKNGAVRHGCWLRHTDARKQLREVLDRYGLYSRIRPFTLCLECNGRIARVAKNRVTGHLSPGVRLYYNHFYLCRSCRKVYWKGTHYDRMMKLVSRVRSRRTGSG